MIPAFEFRKANYLNKLQGPRGLECLCFGEGWAKGGMSQVPHRAGAAFSPSSHLMLTQLLDGGHPPTLCIYSKPIDLKSVTQSHTTRIKSGSNCRAHIWSARPRCPTHTAPSPHTRSWGTQVKYKHPKYKHPFFS